MELIRITYESVEFVGSNELCNLLQQISPYLFIACFTIRSIEFHVRKIKVTKSRIDLSIEGDLLREKLEG